MSGTPPHVNETSLPRIVQAVRELFQGRSNAVGAVTLATGTTTTTVTAANVSLSSKPILQARTANAAAAVATTYVSAVTQGAFTITHANNAQTDRNFFWVALG